MFKVGTTYQVGMVIYVDEGAATETWHNCVCTEVAMPVVKFAQSGKEWIVNTSSPMFVEARPQ